MVGLLWVEPLELAVMTSSSIRKNNIGRKRDIIWLFCLEKSGIWEVAWVLVFVGAWTLSISGLYVTVFQTEVKASWKVQKIK